MQRGSSSLRPRKEESIISFEVGLDEAVELPGVAVAEAATPADALLSPSHRHRPTPAPAMNGGASVAPALTSALRGSALASTASLHTAVPSRAKSTAQPAALASHTGGVTSLTATSPPTAGTPSSGSGSGSGNGHGGGGGGSSFHAVSALTWADTSAPQREAEARASHESSFHPMLLCPLQNLGNTCYFNSGVQLLVNCPALVYGLRAAPFARPTAAVPSHALPSASPTARPATAARLCLRGGPATHALCQEFASLLASMDADCGGNTAKAISPIRTLDALARVYPQFEGRSQQDASEMVTALLASLEEEGGQYAEVSQLLLSFEEAAAAAQRRTGQSPSTGSSHRGSAAVPSVHHVTSTSASLATAGVPLPARCSEPYTGEEFSQPSPLSTLSAEAGLPGPRSAHSMTVLRLMEQVNRENEQLERRVKERAGKPYTGSFRPPRLHLSPLVDGFRGYSLSQVECHHCRAVSRVVSPFNGLMLDVPTTKQRKRFAVAHPDVPRRMDPDGQPRQVKKPFRLTWWNPLSICAAAWAQLKRFFEGPFPYPLWLDECLDIHFEPELLHGSNRYRCESCGTTSDATKSETLLQLPEYLLVHMKRFEAGRFFNRKKTDAVFFPAAWQPLTPAQAAAQPRGDGRGRQRPARAPLPEFLDLRPYLHRSVACFAEPIPACLAPAANSASSGGSHTNKRASPTASSRAEPHSSHHPPPQRPRAASGGGGGGMGHTTAATTSDTPLAAAAGNASPPSASSAIATTYTLDGIINHHGGYDGGHYTVFLHKTTAQQRVWVYISDDEIERAEEVVATDTEYVLLYRRQPLVQGPPESDEAEQLRRKACYYLSPSSGAAAAAAASTTSKTTNANGATSASASTSNGAAARANAPHAPSPSSFSSSSTDGTAPAGHAASPSSSSVVYISRLWLQRVAFMREPGPIVNALCYCRPEDQQRVSMYPSLFPASVRVPAEVPHVHGPPVEWFYVAITPADYEIFYNAFGGGAAVTVREYEALREMQVEFCADIDAAERQRQRGGSARPGMRR